MASFFTFKLKSAPPPNIVSDSNYIQVQASFFQYPMKKPPPIEQAGNIFSSFALIYLLYVFIDVIFSKKYGVHSSIIALATTSISIPFIFKYSDYIFDFLPFSMGSFKRLKKFYVTFDNSKNMTTSYGSFQKNIECYISDLSMFQCINISDIDSTMTPDRFYAPEMAIVMNTISGSAILINRNSMSLAQNAAIVAALNDSLAYVKKSLHG